MKKRSIEIVITLLLSGSLYAQQAQFDPVPVPVENPITEEKRVLGKILFWDEQLSSNNTVACGTCHKPATGGADDRVGIHPGPDRLFGTDDDVIGSPGIRSLDSNGLPLEDFVFGHNKQVTGRASQSFLTAMYADSNFWDGRAVSTFVNPLNANEVIIASGGALESQAVVPILSSVEMAKTGRTWSEVTNKLAEVVPLAFATDIPPDMAAAISQDSNYPQLFASAFGDSNITPSRIAMAIATYERTLLPDQTPWDLYMAGDLTAMTPDQIVGWERFEGDTVCDNCHKLPQFTDNNFYNIGLRPANEDIGLMAVTGDLNDLGRFKTPSLRNVGLRKSLNHVGWVTDVQDSVDFYNAETNVTSHTQFTENQSGIPTSNPNRFVEYDTLSFFGPSAAMQAIVVDFMSNALTDPRVAAETFPFDRPVLASELAPESVKVMTYNIMDTSWDLERADLVSSIINSENPQVIGLQEASTTQKIDLEERLSNNYEFYNFDTDNSHPILVKKNEFYVLATGSVNEPAFCLQERFVNYLVLQQISTGHTFVVHNSQFCPLQAVFPPEEADALARNQEHAEVLAQTILQNMEAFDAPAIALGDFNATAGSDTMQFLLEKTPFPDNHTTVVELDDSWQFANPGLNRESSADWILFTEGITILEAGTISTDASIEASDHFPLIASIVVEGENSKGNIAGVSTAIQGTEASFRLAISDGSGNSNGFEYGVSDNLTVKATVYIDPTDIGLQGQFYVIASYNGVFYTRNIAGGFFIWDGFIETLKVSTAPVQLSAIESLALVSGLQNLPGLFNFYVAYSTFDEKLNYNKFPLSIEVID